MFTLLFRNPDRLLERPKQYSRFFTPATTVSMVLLLLIVIGCTFAPLFATHLPNATSADNLAPPSAAHWLGADQNGRDIYSRLLYGGRTVLLSALGVVAVSMVAGIPLGLLSGYFGRKIDALIMRMCDVLLSFPSLLLALIFVAGFKTRGISNAVIALGIVYIPMLTRLTRSLTMVEKNKVYVTACVSLGYSDARIMFRHILPNCLSTILVQLTLDIAYAILDLAALSFLGLGVAPPQSDWGAMLSEGRQFILSSPMLALTPGAVIVAVVVSINLFSDGLHQYLDHSQTQLPSFRRFARMQQRRARRAEKAAASLRQKGGQGT